MPLYICMPPGVYTPPYAPILVYACVGLEALHVVGGCNGLPLVLEHPTYMGCLPLTPPHSVIGDGKGSLCIGMFQGHQYVMWAFPSISNDLGVFPPSVGGWRGHWHMRCPYAHSCTFL